jgi:hypothetical protein
MLVYSLSSRYAQNRILRADADLVIRKSEIHAPFYFCSLTSSRIAFILDGNLGDVGWKYVGGMRCWGGIGRSVGSGASCSMTKMAQNSLHSPIATLPPSGRQLAKRALDAKSFS